MVKCPRVIGWKKVNAQPPGWRVWENAPLLPRGMGTAGIDCYIILYIGSLKFLKSTKWMVKQPFRACAVSSTVFNSLFESNRNYESKGTENITPVYMYSK